MRLGALLVWIGLPAVASAQWTTGGGGDHGGWDWVTSDGAAAGGTHTNVNNFAVLEGQTLGTGGVGPTTTVQANRFVLDGILDLDDQELILESGAGVPGTEAGAWPILLLPGYAVIATSLPLYDWTEITDPEVTAAPFTLEVGTTGVVGPGGMVGGIVLLVVGIPVSFYQQIPADGALPPGTYFWRVGADDGATTRWSEVWTFTVSAGGGGTEYEDGSLGRSGSGGSGSSCGFTLFGARPGSHGVVWVSGLMAAILLALIGRKGVPSA